jgi:hypothetical protein
MTIKKLAGKVALIGGSHGIGAVIVKHLAADRADVASVFVTNGGYNGVQQVLRLWRPHGRSRNRPNRDWRLIQIGWERLILVRVKFRKKEIKSKGLKRDSRENCCLPRDWRRFRRVARGYPQEAGGTTNSWGSTISVPESDVHGRLGTVSPKRISTP